MLTDTYSDSDYENLWLSIETACDLFNIIAVTVAENLDYRYIQSEEDDIRNYLRSLHSSRNNE